jgi:hypothetical protein
MKPTARPSCGSFTDERRWPGADEVRRPRVIPAAAHDDTANADADVAVASRNCPLRTPDLRRGWLSKHGGLSAGS